MDGGEEPIWRHGRSGKVDVASLRQLPLFRELSGDILGSLSNVVTWRAYESGEHIIQPGDEWGDVFVLAEGTARVFGRMPNGEEIDVFFLSAGDVVDFDDLPAGPAGDFYCDATGEGAIALHLPRAELDQAVLSTPGAAELHRQARKRLVELAVLFWELVFHDVSTRLGHLLAELAEADPEHMVWETHGALARRLGMRRENVTRRLKALKARGLIDYQPHRRGIKVLDMERLARGI